MKKALILTVIPFLLATVLAHHYLLGKDWYRSVFSGILITIFWEAGMYFFSKWWRKKVREQKGA